MKYMMLKSGFRFATAFVAAFLVSCGGASSTASAADEIRSDSVTTASGNSADSMGVDLGAKRLTLAFVGDIMMGTTFPDSVGGSHLPRNHGRNLFDDCRDILKRVDIAAGNLEGSFLDGPGQRRPMRNPKTYFVFRMPTDYVGNLTDAGFDFLGIANNHINDFGPSGRRSTMTTLRDAGLKYAGLKGSCETAFIDRNGLRIGLTQFGHGGNNLDVTDLNELRRVVKILRDSADIVVVAFHGGAEGAAHSHVPFARETYLGENRGNVAAFAHAAIDAGADVVYGHGPHVPRGAELYKGHIIFYSLGNFCTPYRMGLAGTTGYAPLAEITIDGNGHFVEGRIHSFLQQRGRGPVADPSNKAARFIRQLSKEDFPSSTLQIGDDGTLRIDKDAAVPSGVNK